VLALAALFVLLPGAATLAVPVGDPPAGGGLALVPIGVPPEFVDVAQVAPGIAIDMRYARAQNFVGRPVHGYAAARCLLSRPAAHALALVASDLAARGLGLRVYDCFRPQRAVDDFVAWAHDLSRDQGDETIRARHYPAVPRAELFHRGYIAERSGHTRGSTVDLTLFALSTGVPADGDVVEPDDCRVGESASTADGSLDMGTSFDCFDERAHTAHTGISHLARQHRRWLREAMWRRGFAPYVKEWWHFTLAAEPFPHRYFDFEIR
jgi:D-alanyl-D-alanine dipeptidase